MRQPHRRVVDEAQPLISAAHARLHTGSPTSSGTPLTRIVASVTGWRSKHRPHHAHRTRWRPPRRRGRGGCRKGEAFGLTADHVDWLHRSLWVEQQLVLLGSGPKLGPPKTAASRRTVPLPDVVLNALSHHVATYPLGPDDLIFTDDRGRPIRRNRFNEAWHRSVVATGIPDGTGFHDLRHYYASLLIRHGESVKVVQDRLGHASAMETLDTYGHLWPDSDDRTRAAVDAVLGVTRLPVVEAAGDG